jgi:hypothetical protein
MIENPYAAPTAALSSLAGSHPIKVYSPTQVACGTIGGPVGLIYFLWRNFIALGNEAAARKTLWYGVIGIVVLLALLFALPAKFPSSPFTIAYILIARGVANKYQLTKDAIAASPNYEFHSNWRVFGLGLLCLLGSVIVLIGPVMVLSAMGLEPA